MIPEYILSIDGENTEELGVFEIANTDSPAIQMKGIAFSTHKELFFKDDLKYRIASPVLTPSKIYRVDEETGEESYYVSKPDFIEKVYAKFMASRVGKDVFNEEHDESKRVPSYILETWIVEKPKEDKSFTTYGIECPAGTWFAVQQFTDKDVYVDYVKRGLTGFSIHGNANLIMREIKQQNTNEMVKFKAKKRKIVAHYMDAEKAESGEVIIAVDELAVGADVVVLDEDMKEVDNFTGALETNEGVITITEGAIEAIGEEVVATEDMKEEEVVEASEEVVEEEAKVEAEEEMEEEVEVKAEGEFYTKEEIDAKIKEITDYIAEHFDKMKETAKDEAEDVAEEVVDEVQMKMSLVSAWKNPKLKFNKNK